MLNIRQRWAEIRRIEAAITDEQPFLMSLEDRRRGFHGGGVVQVATRESAARFIFDGSHRLATPEEVAKHIEADQARKAAAAGEVLRKAGFRNLCPGLP